MIKYSRFFLLIASLLFAVSCKPRCPIASCQTRMVHTHNKKEFRGQPWYKKQSPKIGEKLGKVPKETQKVNNNKANYKKK